MKNENEIKMRIRALQLLTDRARHRGEVVEYFQAQIDALNWMLDGTEDRRTAQAAAPSQEDGRFSRVRPEEEVFAACDSEYDQCEKSSSERYTNGTVTYCYDCWQNFEKAKMEIERNL